MTETVAIWTDAPKDSKEPPELNLHVNIWDRLIENQIAVDFGIQFKSTAQNGDTIFLFLPVPLTNCKLDDLWDVMRNEKTLSAVFNSTVASLNADPSNYTDFTLGNGDQYRLHNLFQILSTEEVVGDDIEFGSGFIVRLDISKLTAPAAGSHYLRFRILIGDRSKQPFSTIIDPPSDFIESSFKQRHLVEFRLNERRNFPGVISSRTLVGTFPKINLIQYFLVRDASHDLSGYHVDCRKKRRFENDLWSEYLGSLGGEHANSLIIYHWREEVDPGKNATEDFVALATFDELKSLTLRFIFIVVLLGALGSAVCAFFFEFIQGLFDHPVSIASFAIVIIVTLGAIVALIAQDRWRQKNRKQIRDTA
ncbi:MAG: hypothetical protein ACFE0S_05565 [Rhodospirillales bacterium]